ncbi:MAG: tetratricopeptide repeat protein [Methanolobus sp.]|uniref:tetratricopeptide repeat protein n=1 Tax=Methanolobus sp. TaxID=1874737 RepID=UPI002730385D|nr:tetratricopeptide repeat protein [Methanolobus sp.]MDP2216973.1 tetratricopeptide repeat protein [Methanolobus sp.]
MIKLDFERVNVKTLLNDAENGDTEQQIRLANRYIVGLGVDIDYIEAAKWYERAAENGHPELYFRLALIYEVELLEGGIDNVIKFLELAGQNGYPDAYYRLGLYYFVGVDISRDFEKAVEYFKAGGNKGSAHSWMILGNIHFFGFDTPRNTELALSYYELAANLGFLAAWRMLGRMYFWGIDVKQDIPKAITYKSKSYIDKRIKVDTSFSDGTDYLFQRFFIDWFNSSLNDDSLIDYLSIGKAYGLNNDVSNMQKYYLKAADAGDLEAYENLGRYFSESHHENQEMALKYFKMGGEKGSSYCIERLVHGNSYSTACTKELLQQASRNSVVIDLCTFHLLYSKIHDKWASESDILEYYQPIAESTDPNAYWMIIENYLRHNNKEQSMHWINTVITKGHSVILKKHYLHLINNDRNLSTSEKVDLIKTIALSGQWEVIFKLEAPLLVNDEREARKISKKDKEAWYQCALQLVLDVGAPLNLLLGIEKAFVKNCGSQPIVQDLLLLADASIDKFWAGVYGSDRWHLSEHKYYSDALMTKEADQAKISYIFNNHRSHWQDVSKYFSEAIEPSNQVKSDNNNRPNRWMNRAFAFSWHFYKRIL